MPGVDTTDDRLQQWWDALSDQEQAGLLSTDLDRPLPYHLLAVVTRAKVFAPAVATWWEHHTESATWHATSRVRDFVDSKRQD